VLLQWEPFDFGLRRANIRVAQSARDVANAQVAVTRLQPGTAVADAYLTIAAAQQTVLAARVAHSMDQKTRSMAVELDVTNAGGRLAPGTYPTERSPVTRSTLFVPATSILTTTERTFVIRVRDGVADWVDVGSGDSDGEFRGDFRRAPGWRRDRAPSE